MLFVHEIANALYQKQWYLLVFLNGFVLRLHTSFRWPTRITGSNIISAVGFHFRQKKEDPSTLCKMGYYLIVVYIGYLTLTSSQSTLIYIYFILYFMMADDYLRTITRLYASMTLKKILAVNIFLRSFLIILRRSKALKARPAQTFMRS